jgi:hypothetical protein
MLWLYSPYIYGQCDKLSGGSGCLELWCQTDQVYTESDSGACDCGNGELIVQCHSNGDHSCVLANLYGHSSFLPRGCVTWAAHMQTMNKAGYPSA